MAIRIDPALNAMPMRLQDEFRREVAGTRRGPIADAVLPLNGALLDRQARIDALTKERDGLMQTLRDEMDENLRLRELGGARPDENITAMTERIIAERDNQRQIIEAFDIPLHLVPMHDEQVRLRAEVKALHAENEDMREDAERYRWLRANVVGVMTFLRGKVLSSDALKGAEFDDAIDAFRGDDGLDGDLCPNCVTPWKCNGPHIAEPIDAAIAGKEKV